MSMRFAMSKTLLSCCLLFFFACGTAPSEPDHAQQLREAIYAQDSLAAKTQLDSLRDLRQRLHQRADTTGKDSL